MTTLMCQDKLACAHEIAEMGPESGVGVLSSQVREGWCGVMSVTGCTRENSQQTVQSMHTSASWAQVSLGNC